MRRAVLVLSTALGLSPWAAAPAVELAACRAVPDDGERLRCYDALADGAAAPPVSADAGREPPRAAPAAAASPAPGTRAASPVPAAAAPAAVAAVAPPAAPTPSPEALFGLDPVQSESAVREAAGIRRLDELELRLTAVRADASGKPVFTFDNGQVWAQIDSTRARLAIGDVVRIRRAAFGSYLLLRPDGGRGIGVRRIG